MTLFQIMAGFDLPSPQRRAQFADSSVHWLTHHAPAAPLLTYHPPTKAPRCSPNHRFPALISSSPTRCLSSLRIPPSFPLQTQASRDSSLGSERFIPNAC